MTKRTKPVVASVIAVLQPVTTTDLIEHIISTVKTSRQFGIEPYCAVTVVERDGEYCGAVLCLYTAEAGVNRDGKAIVELAPQFYPSEVATELQTRGLLIESQTTRRTGIGTTWCYFSDTFI